MASENGCRFTPNVVVGIAMTAAGIVLMLDTLGIVNAREMVQFWPVLLILFGASVIVQAFSGGPNDGRRQRPIVTPGLVIVFVVGGLIASNALQRRVLPRAGRDGNSVIAIMGKTERTSTARTFTGANMTTVMGDSRLDLRQTTLAPGEQAVVDVFGMMGGVELLVPEGWVVDVQAVPVMGRVNDMRWRTGASAAAAPPAPAPPPDTAPAPEDDAAAAAPVETGPPPRVVVRGFIMMGRLTIRS